LSEPALGGSVVRRRPPRAAWLVLGAGLGLVLAAQLLSPVAAPLYDGLIVLGPYKYLEPGPGQTGSPTSGSVTEAVADGSSPGFNAATTETVPQAQLIAAPGAFALAPGSTSVTVTIAPVLPPGPSTVGTILGNVYRFSVTDQAGTALATKPGIDVTIVLRAPDATSDAVFAQYGTGSSAGTSGGSGAGSAGWTLIPSSPSGTPAFFLAMTGGAGDYALVEAAGGFGVAQAAILAVVVTAILAVAGFFLLRRRRRARAIATPPGGSPSSSSSSSGSGKSRPPTTNRKKRKRR
jgi:hypothetical protein